MSSNIRWICENDNVEITTISNVETMLGVKFPKDYIEIAMKMMGDIRSQIGSISMIMKKYLIIS